MSIPGFDLAQARYDAASPPDGHECVWCDRGYDDCDCAESDKQAHDDAMIERGDARRKGDEWA